jgi:hypothetical protein
MKEFRADPVVEADAACDLLHVGAGALSQIGDLVDERDLGGQECIFARALVVGPHDNAVRQAQEL